ncbi:MAPEG family protein [Gammaproteobacteria bacterium]|nr:MAPEG family protein [Gammaproteobacteria bacterium]
MITLFYAGSLTLLAIVLATLTGRRRIKSEINLGLGEDFGMLQISRAHGNLLENAFFFLILSFALEMIAQVSSITIMILGDVFLISRIAHAYGITRPEAKSLFRFLGTAGTMIVLIIQTIMALVISITWLANNNWGF